MKLKYDSAEYMTIGDILIGRTNVEPAHISIYLKKDNGYTFYLHKYDQWKVETYKSSYYTKFEHVVF